MQPAVLVSLFLLGGCHLVISHAPAPPSASDAAGASDRTRLDGSRERRTADLARESERPNDLTLVGSCPPICNKCVANTCYITSNCGSGCSCPEGMDCQVQCSATGCQGNVDCSKASSCLILCGPGCQQVRCGEGPCEVHCSGEGCSEIDCKSKVSCKLFCSATLGKTACNKELRCGSGTCEVTCTGTGGPACGGGVDCTDASSCKVSCTGAACGSAVKCGTGHCSTSCQTGASAAVSCGQSSPCCVSNQAGATCTASCPAGCPVQAAKPCWCAGCP